jgi:KaiC/GvpD/RAD55 family RecA-like ATPase
MDEVFPQKYSVLLLGPPGVGKSEYCMDLVRGYLKKGEKVVYVTTEKSPSEVRKRMKELGVDLDVFEGNSLLFIDVFTRSVGPKDEKVLHVDNPANLNMVSVRLSEAVKALGKPVRIVFDSLSTFFLHASEGEIRRFFETVNTKVKMDYGFVIYTLQEEMHDKKVVIALKAMVDAVLEMKPEEAPGRKKKLRVLFAKGITYPNDWVEFRITKHGFELTPVRDIPVSIAKVSVVKRELPLVKVAGLVALLILGVAGLQLIFGGEKDAPAIKTTPALETTPPSPIIRQTDTPSPTVTIAPPAVTVAPTTRAPLRTLPPETPPPITEYRLNGMEDVGSWFLLEGASVILDIAESTEFSKVGKSLRVDVEILGGEETFAGIGLFNPEIRGYDGLTVWSYAPEPFPVGRLGMLIKEKDGSDYWYLRMRSLKQEGWVKDIVPFDDFRLRPPGPEGENYDENNRLDLDQAEILIISVSSFGPTDFKGRFTIFIDELNLFRYQNVSR